MSKPDWYDENVHYDMKFWKDGTLSGAFKAAAEFMDKHRIDPYAVIDYADAHGYTVILFLNEDQYFKVIK